MHGLLCHGLLCHGLLCHGLLTQVFQLHKWPTNTGFAKHILWRFWAGRIIEGDTIILRRCTCMYNVHVHTLSSERVNQLPPSLSRSSCPRHDDPLHRPAGFNDPWADAELEMGERDGRQEQTSLRRWARCSLPTGRLQGEWGNIVTLFGLLVILVTSFDSL